MAPEHHDDPDRRAISGAEWRLLAVLLVVAAVLRVAVHDVPHYSRADEQSYVDMSCAVHGGGLGAYPALVHDWLADPGRAVFPSPLRWGWIAAGAAAFSLAGACTPSALGWLSTAAGIVAAGMTFVLGRRLLGTRAGLLALALSVPSALQLALGRRALTDEPWCALALVAIWGVLRLVDAERPRARDFALPIAALAAAFSVKETTFLLWPALAAPFLLAWKRRRPRPADALVFALPPALHFAGFALLDRGAEDFFAIMRTITSAVGAPYAARFQAGPPHRLLLDLFALSPAVCLVAAGALAVLALPRAPRDPGAVRLAWVGTLAIAAFALFPSKNLRYVVAGDPMLRLLAAQYLEAHQLRPRGLGLGWLVALGVVSLAIELPLFESVFLEGAVYDPVTDGVLRALHMIP